MRIENYRDYEGRQFQYGRLSFVEGSPANDEEEEEDEKEGWKEGAEKEERKGEDAAAESARDENVEVSQSQEQQLVETSAHSKAEHHNDKPERSVSPLNLTQSPERLSQ